VKDRQDNRSPSRPCSTLHCSPNLQQPDIRTWWVRVPERPESAPSRPAPARIVPGGRSNRKTPSNRLPADRSIAELSHSLGARILFSAQGQFGHRLRDDRADLRFSLSGWIRHPYGIWMRELASNRTNSHGKSSRSVSRQSCVCTTPNRRVAGSSPTWGATFPALRFGTPRADGVAPWLRFRPIDAAGARADEEPTPSTGHSTADCHWVIAACAAPATRG
jgi:hypothetical protein